MYPRIFENLTKFLRQESLVGQGLGKQAKELSEGQIRAALSAVEKRRYPERDRATILLSVRLPEVW
jgi:hypothetical protein